MTKIRDVIQINSGYTSYVDVYEEYNDLVKNRGRMERYKPIAAHRQAFEKIANSLNPKDRRCYFLSGSYGTGKSHLLLMTANYFANPSDLPEIKTFFENYAVAQNEILIKPDETFTERKAASLKEARKSGRFLVALCRFSLNLDFEGTALRALLDALQKDESDIILDCHYLEAVRRIRKWEERRNDTRFFSDLETSLGKHFPDWTINDLIEGLENYNEQALQTFKTCFHAVTDTDFSYDKDNLRDIISDLLKNSEFKKRYQGIVFIYDEFGSAIDANHVNYSTFLDFAQFCASSTLEKGGAVIFIGAGHKAFRNHGKIGDLNAETLEARVTEIGLQTQGMEDIIAAIVQQKKDSPDWEHIIESNSGMFTWFSNECNRLQLFNWLKAPKIKNNIIINIFPMHPLATFALLRLAGEAGSDNRSVFTFFAPEFDAENGDWKNVQPFSYPWFVENHEIDEKGKLALYTADLLVDYFRESLKASNNRLIDRVKNSVMNYDATLIELNGYLARKSQDQLFDEVDLLMQRIIKVILINEIASTPEAQIVNTIQNIEFALDAVSTDEKNQVETRLELLCNAGILFRNHEVYELVRSDRKDVTRFVDQYKANPANHPTNLLQDFQKYCPLRSDEVYLEAKDYNAQYSEDKRLKVCFVPPTLLAEKTGTGEITRSFFMELEEERNKIVGATNKYEGSTLFVFCENETDIEIAKKATISNDQQRIAIAIPKNPISIGDAILTLKAFESETFLAQEQTFGPYERAEQKKIKDGALQILAEAKASYFSNNKVHWFGVNGSEIPVQENKRHSVADLIMHNLYDNRRNKFGHNEFNKAHINISQQIKGVFKEAGDILCDHSQPVRVNWSWPDNRGGTKYLRRCFVDHQVLRITTTEGDIRFLETEKDLAKFGDSLPSYAKLLKDLADLEGKPQVNFHQFIRPLFEEYGQGEIAITLMLLLARRFYGDSLRFKTEPNNLTDMLFTGTEDMLSLVQGSSASAVIIFEPVSIEDQTYFAKITQTFTNQPAPAGKIYSINEAFQAISNWWEKLPPIARSLAFYADEEQPFAKAFSQLKTKDPFQFIKHELVELLGLTPGEILKSSKITHIEVYLKAFKTMSEAIQSQVQERILKEVADIFDSTSSLDVDIQEKFKSWYDNLSSTQKDPLAQFHNDDSRPLVKHIALTDIHELFFKTLPEAYSLGSVGTWLSDFVEELARRIRSGKNHIEIVPGVPPVKIECSDALSRNENQIKYKAELILHVDTEDGQGVIYYTSDGSDPSSNPNRQKLAPGDTLTITGNRKIKMVVSDGQGNYSSVKTIDAIDELQKHKIVRAEQPGFEEMVSFVFPQNKEAARITILSLITELLNSNLMPQDVFWKMIQEISDELKKS